MDTIKEKARSFNYLLFFLVIGISIFGIIIIGSVGTTKSDVFRIFNSQKKYFLISLFAMIIVACIDYKFICKFYILIYIFNIILLVVVLKFPSAASVATKTARWITIAGFNVQPSEFSKLFLVLFFATYIDKFKHRINNIFFLISIIVLTLVPAYLISEQPSLSASLVSIILVIVIIFVSEIHFGYILGALGIAVSAIYFIFYDIMHNGEKFLQSLVNQKIIKYYHITRIKSFIEQGNTEDFDTYRQTFHSVNAIGSGRLYGKGLYKGKMNNLGFVDNSHNDFIFSVIGEELGFVGCIFAIILMFLIICCCLYIARKASSNLGRLIASGVAGIFIFQAFVNIGVATSLLPNTGMAFPFLSSGGSSLLVNMVCVGIVLNIGMDKPKSFFRG